MSKKRLITAGVAVVAALALSASALAVVGGSPDTAHPYAGAAVIQTSQGTEICSGVLVDATTFVTAAHCLQGDFKVGAILVSTDVQFTGPKSFGAAYFVDPDYAVGDKGLSSSDRNDVAVIKLAVPLPGPYAQLPSANYTDTLKNNQAVDVVGYGLPMPGVRQSASAKIIPGGGKVAPWFLKITAGTMCNGDSGGPIVQSGTNIVLAINSYGAAANCAAVGYAQRLDTPDVLRFINSHR